MRQVHAQKAHERLPVLDQIVAPLVRKPVHRQKDQHIEHQNMIEGGASAACPVRARNRAFKIPPERLGIDDRRDPLDRRPWPTTRTTLVRVEKPWIVTFIASLRFNLRRLNQILRQMGRF